MYSSLLVAGLIPISNVSELDIEKVSGFIHYSVMTASNWPIIWVHANL